METDWMPVMMPYGGTGHGMYLMPEIGTEVVIGFRFGDRGKPFVMGALLENMDSVPETDRTENNPVRKRMGSCSRTQLDRIKWPSLPGRNMGVR